jgi:hypothetical protein
MNRPSQRHRVVVTAVGARIIDLYHSTESQARSVVDTEFPALGALLGANRASA